EQEAMSVNAANDFVGKIFEDPALRNKLFSKIGDIQHVDLSQDTTAGETIVAVGQEWGFQFDVADLQSAYRGYIEQNMNSSRGVLSESDLELVSGGVEEASLCDNTLCNTTCAS